MDWTFVSWHVLWSHALILAVTVAMAGFLQIFGCATHYTFTHRSETIPRPSPSSGR